MIHTLAGLLLLATAGAQEETWTESRFHRVHLKNGNFIDGKLVRDAADAVTLQLKPGQFTIRRDLVDRVEMVKIRSLREVADKPPVPPPGGAVQPPPVPPTQVPTVDTPEEIRRAVDQELRRLKTSQNDSDMLSVETLAALGGEAAAYLASLVPKLEPKLQMHACSALGALKSPQSVPILEGYLSSPDPIIRAYAGQALGSMGDAEKLRYLRAMLRDPDPGVRANTLALLSSVQDRDWFGPVSDLMTDPDKDIRAKAINLAGQLADRNGLGEEYAAILQSNLGRVIGETRADLLAAIGGTGKQQHWKTLVLYLRDSDATVRAAAALALTNLNVLESGPDAVEALAVERDRLTRVYLAGIAQKLKLAKAVGPLIEWMNDPDEELQRVAAVALQSITGETFGLDRAKWIEWYRQRGSNP